MSCVYSSLINNEGDYEMTKAFNKGDAVTLVSDWDRKGSTYYRHAIVYSCGKKQMVLTDAETGEEIGRHFRPERAELGNDGTFARMTDDEATAAGLVLAVNILARETAQFERCLQDDIAGEGYKNAIRRSLAQLHAPDAASYKQRSGKL
jgi:hypothetical protein